MANRVNPMSSFFMVYGDSGFGALPHSFVMLTRFSIHGRTFPFVPPFIRVQTMDPETSSG
jgi:hypothetical protein